MPFDFDRLGPVLGHIADQFTPILPKPLSGYTKGETMAVLEPRYEKLPDDGDPGTTSRAAIRQGDLANLLRTSIAWNVAAAPVLYRRVITDDLPALVHNFGNPSAHPHIASKAQLLRITRHLHLEYCRKTDEPSYPLIMGDAARWADVGLAVRGACCVANGLRELARLGDCYNTLNPSHPFPSVIHLTFGSVFGGQDAIWRRIANDAHPTDTIASCISWLHMLAARSPLLHLCQRVNAGPFSLPTAIEWPSGSASEPAPIIPLITVHFDTTSPFVSLLLDHPTRWILEKSGRPVKFGKTATFISSGLKWLVENAPGGPQRLGPLEIYASSYLYELDPARNLLLIPPTPPRYLYNRLPLESEIAIFSHSKDVALQQTQSGTWLYQSIAGWRCSPESPTCEACGWVFEENEEDEWEW